jgi:hypothetical protein
VSFAFALTLRVAVGVKRGVDGGIIGVDGGGGGSEAGFGVGGKMIDNGRRRWKRRMKSREGKR